MESVVSLADIADYRQRPSKIAHGVRHQTSQHQAFVKVPRPFGDQSGGARKWAIRDGCQTWFREGVCRAPVTPPGVKIVRTTKSKGGKSRSTGRSKQLVVGTGATLKYAHDPMSPGLLGDAGVSDGVPWDPIRNPLPYLPHFRQPPPTETHPHPQQTQKHVDEQHLIPRMAPQPIQAGAVHHGLVSPQYGQPQAYSNMSQAYAHQQYGYGGGGGGGGWASYQGHPGYHFPSAPEYSNGNDGSGWCGPGGNNFTGFNEPTTFERQHPIMSREDDMRSNAHSQSRSSPGPEGEYSFNQANDYPKRETRETSSPLSSPPPGAGMSDA